VCTRFSPPPQGKKQGCPCTPPQSTSLQTEAFLSNSISKLQSLSFTAPGTFPEINSDSVSSESSSGQGSLLLAPSEEEKIQKKKEASFRYLKRNLRIKFFNKTVLFFLEFFFPNHIANMKKKADGEEGGEGSDGDKEGSGGSDGDGEGGKGSNGDGKRGGGKKKGKGGSRGGNGGGRGGSKKQVVTENTRLLGFGPTTKDNGFKQTKYILHSQIQDDFEKSSAKYRRDYGMKSQARLYQDFRIETRVNATGICTYIYDFTFTYNV
jgi:hypothetical protein